MHAVSLVLRFLHANRIKPTPSGKEEVVLKESEICLANGFHIYVESIPI